MTTLPNGIEVPDEDEYIWEVYLYRCVAHPTRYATALHEQPPRSLNPHWKDMPETRFPVCSECHALVHTLSPQDAGYYLEQARKHYFSNAIERLNGHTRKTHSD